MSILSSLDAAYVKILNLRACLRHAVVTTGILILAAIFIACAGGFAIAAGYMWLETQMSGPAAALCVAGGLTLAGLLIIAVAMSRRPVRHRGTVSRAGSQSTVRQADELEELADVATRELISTVSKSPGSAALTAVALGVVVGLLRSKETD